MSELFVINSLNTSKSVKFNVALRYFVVKSDHDGDQKWVLEIGTTHSGADGTTPLFKKIHGISSEDLDEVLENAVAELCGEIDWTPFITDKEAPYVEYMTPEGDDTSIGSSVSIRIKEHLPAAGIDLSNMSVVFNNGEVNFDITNEVEVVGDPYQYDIKWLPPRI